MSLVQTRPKMEYSRGVDDWRKDLPWPHVHVLPASDAGSAV
jgi:hypothetical protein